MRFGGQKINFNQLRDANRARQRTSFRSCLAWLPSDWSNALAGEVGEACNLIKKLRRGEVVNKDDIAKELADVVIYSDLLAVQFGIDLGQAVRDKFNEVSARVGSKIEL
jgi:NTP pyrophosphatase (non-canonical NTP hydrolase)